MDKAHLDLNLIRAFLQVVDHGSFTKAAQALHKPKSNLSRQVSLLEETLGVALIYRTTRQFQLTETGKEFYRSLKPKLEQLESALELLDRDRDDISGLIRVTVPQDLGMAVFPEICEEFRKLHPAVTFDVIVTDTFVDLVKDSIDLAIRIGELEDSSLLAQKLGKVETILVASKSLLERIRPIQKVDDLKNAPTLTFNDDRPTQSWTLKSGASAKKVEIHPVYNSDNFFVLRDLSLRGAGITSLPLFLCAESLRAGDLIRVLPQFSTDSVPISIVMPSQKIKHAKIKVFSEFLKKKLLQLGVFS